ncbi:hypothetical protein VaNZ11_007397 [Volvox africanus]|uniref:AB hydrolase-1 domain-containing protein n=1 Tax=Volvox africanus TaxID=51714 RepID=A0ABQ5S3Q8_9CHLO|nr:hypothetical protein VaNZ11_007397 [Volvox africanus]
MTARSPRGIAKWPRARHAKRPKPQELKQNLSWAFRSSLLPVLLLAVLALASFGAESRRLHATAVDATQTYPNVYAFTAVVPKPNITIQVDESRGGRRSISSSSTSDGGVASLADGAASTTGTGATGTGGSKGGMAPDADLVGPVVSGDVSGLFQHLAPNSSVPVSAYSLRIDDMAGLVTPKGYPLEQHVVVTGDGYKLGTFRIPYGRSGRGAVKRPPVLLIHGISLASTCWVINQPTESLAFILADRGYDVWMMNTRGNTFSREHVLYRDTQSSFWRFSVDEMAKWDLRETMKYIQDVTGISKVGLVGHSQGGTIALMALSDDPWLADSVSVLVALGPCAYVKYMTSVVLKNFCRQANTSEIFKLLPPQELVYMSVQMQQTYLNGVCQMPGTMLTCLTTMEGIFGASRRITAAQYRRYWQIWPSSTSLGNAMQWAEIYNEPKARFFHSGYGPEYKLENVKAPIIMVSGGNDVLAAMEDVAEQKRRLRKVLRKELHVPEYSHMDFIWDTGAVRTVYPIVLESLAESFA